LTPVSFPGPDAGSARQPGQNPAHGCAREGELAATQCAHDPAIESGSAAIGPTTAVLKKSLIMVPL